MISVHLLVGTVGILGASVAAWHDEDGSEAGLGIWAEDGLDYSVSEYLQLGQTVVALFCRGFGPSCVSAMVFGTPACIEIVRPLKLHIRADVWLFPETSAVILPEVVVFVVAVVEERIISALHPLAWIELVEEEVESLHGNLFKISLWLQEAGIEPISR